MCTRWLQERRRNYYYRSAKREGYRSRAAYKLIQINNKYRIIRKNHVVIDLGAAPGGWSQVAAKLVGTRGLVISVDIIPMVSLQNVIFIEGDIALRTTQARVIATLKKHKRTKADVIISDIAPKLSGNRTIDNARALELWMHALQFATLALKPGGAMIIKVFQGDACQYFLAKVDSTFEFWKLYRPEATRMRSAEIYMIAKGFKP